MWLNVLGGRNENFLFSFRPLRYQTASLPDRFAARSFRCQIDLWVVAMVGGKIVFSSGKGEISRSDFDLTGKISEDYFGTEGDSDQISVSEENKSWIYHNVLDYFCVLRDSSKIIGYTLMLPCSRNLMERFISKDISEFNLFEEIKKFYSGERPEVIYLCASVVDEKYRHRGLASSSFIETIKRVTDDLKIKPILFYWGFSEEGKGLAEKVASVTGLEIKRRDE